MLLNLLLNDNDQPSPSGLWRCVRSLVTRWSSPVSDSQRQDTRRVSASALRSGSSGDSSEEMTATRWVLTMQRRFFPTNLWVYWMCWPSCWLSCWRGSLLASQLWEWKSCVYLNFPVMCWRKLTQFDQRFIKWVLKLYWPLLGAPMNCSKGLDTHTSANHRPPAIWITVNSACRLTRCDLSLLGEMFLPDPL